MVVTRVGEIVDFSCYLLVGKHGEKHRDCAQKCMRSGQPIGLLTQDGTLYMLMEEEHDPRRDGMTNFRQAAIDHAAQIIEVTGTQWPLNGYHGCMSTGLSRSKSSPRPHGRGSEWAVERSASVPAIKWGF